MPNLGRLQKCVLPSPIHINRPITLESWHFEGFINEVCGQINGYPYKADAVQVKIFHLAKYKNRCTSYKKLLKVQLAKARHRMVREFLVRMICTRRKFLQLSITSSSPNTSRSILRIKYLWHCKGKGHFPIWWGRENQVWGRIRLLIRPDWIGSILCKNICSDLISNRNNNWISNNLWEMQQWYCE